MSEVSHEDLRAAMLRYPGLPMPLAVSKFMLDKVMKVSSIIGCR